MEKTNKMNEKNKETKANFLKIYIGPDVPKYNLQENNIFTKEFPVNIKEAMEEYPIIKNLMLDIKEIKNRNQENYKILYKSLKEEIGGK